ncbi:uncharacterized protein [Chironomus tepperi]|uniref:uncharacterized protein n=1 Tax=Chironomus tepperi TaxID=113505 RepID=UPI00391F02E5
MDQETFIFKKQSLLCNIDQPVSLDDALNLISACNFSEYIQKKQIIEIHLKINKELDKEEIKLSLESQLVAKMSAIITFQSTVDNESRIFWKTADQVDFKRFETSDDPDGFLTKLCHNFLVDKLQKGETGLKNDENLKVFNPLHIGNKDGHNLLSIAVKQNNSEMVDKLLMYNFDVDFEVKEHNGLNISIIDLAWRTYTDAHEEDVKISSSSIICNLLRYHAKFPKNFITKDASTNIQKLVSDRMKLHKYIQLRDYKALKGKIESEDYNLNYYYDNTNQSLLMHALRMNIDSDTLNILKSLNLSIANHENREALEIYERMRDKNQSNAKDLPEAHIFMLEAKSKIADYNHQNPEYSKLILEAYQRIDENECCSNVLKVAAACKRLKIFFDFKYDTTYYFDPLTSIQTKGTVYKTGEIHIGAKELLDEKKKNQVYGVIIHELCHLAILMTYFNNFDPYQMGESEDKTRFVDKVVNECQGNNGIEGMVDNVFNSYIPKHFHSEIIVLFCQMLMHYYVKDSQIDNDNFKIIKDRERIFSELFIYFKEIVNPELIKVLPTLRKLQDDDQEVKFYELTEPMKAKVLNKRIKFQGTWISIFEIIGNDEDILKRLTSDDIKNILLNRNVFVLGKVCKASTKYKYIERSFKKFVKNHENNEIEEDIEKVKTVESKKSIENVEKIEAGKIMDRVQESKTFILTAKAGEGKTAAFENLTLKLKEKNKNFWVSFIKLRDFRHVFEEIINRETITINDIFNIIVNILFPCSKEERIQLNSKFKFKVFKKLFDDGKVILLLDGIDEISPQFNKLMLHILRILKINTKNQLWISTRPQHAEQLMDALGVDAFTLNPYGYNERRQLIRNICIKLKKNTNFYTLNNLYSFFGSYNDFNNPMLIILVTELYLNGKIDFKGSSYDYFGIYKLLVDEQFDKIDSKVDCKDRNLSLNFSLLHQVLALKFIFNNEDIKDLKILKKWEKEKKNWTVEKIQRYGYIVVDLNFLENNQKVSIDFIHYSIAEFFVAQYIIDNIFNENQNDKEIELIFELIKTLKLKNTKFLLDYLNNHWNMTEENIHRRLVKKIVDEIEKCSKINVKYGDLDCLRFWCPFLRNEPELLKNIWQVNQKKTLLNKILFSYELCEKHFYEDFFNLNILDFINDCFGDNWHEILNKSGEKLNIVIKSNDDFDFEFPKKTIFINF